MELSALHIGLLGFVIYFQCHLSRLCTRANPDIIKDNLQNTISKIPSFITMLPAIYLLFNHETTSERMADILQFIIGCGIIVLSIDTFKKCMNPQSDTNTVDYALPFHVITLLSACFFNVIHKRHHMSFVVALLSLHVLTVYNNSASCVTTSSMVNDIILSTLVFMMNKQQLQ